MLRTFLGIISLILSNIFGFYAAFGKGESLCPLFLLCFFGVLGIAVLPPRIEKAGA